MRKSILPEADVVLQEPVMKLETTVPTEFLGPVSAYIVSHRGLISSWAAKTYISELTAEVPQATIFDYAEVLRSMTKGQGSFTMEFLCYRDTPKSIQANVLKRRG